MIRRALPGDGKWEGEFNERASTDAEAKGTYDERDNK